MKTSIFGIFSLAMALLLMSTVAAPKSPSLTTFEIVTIVEAPTTTSSTTTVFNSVLSYFDGVSQKVLNSVSSYVNGSYQDVLNSVVSQKVLNSVSSYVIPSSSLNSVFSYVDIVPSLFDGSYYKVLDTVMRYFDIVRVPSLFDGSPLSSSQTISLPYKSTTKTNKTTKNTKDDNDSFIGRGIYLCQLTWDTIAQVVRGHFESRLHLVAVYHRPKKAQKKMSTALIPYVPPKVPTFKLTISMDSLQQTLQKLSLKAPPSVDKLFTAAVEIAFAILTTTILTVTATTNQDTAIAVYCPSSASSDKPAAKANPFGFGFGFGSASGTKKSSPFGFGATSSESSRPVFGAQKSNPFGFGASNSNPFGFGTASSSSESSSRPRFHKKKKKSTKSKRTGNTTTCSVSYESFIEGKVTMITNEMMTSEELDTEKKVRSYYRRLSLKWHPDKNKDDKDADEIFKKITEKMEQKIAQIKKESSTNDEDQQTDEGFKLLM